MQSLPVSRPAASAIEPVPAPSAAAPAPAPAPPPVASPPVVLNPAAVPQPRIEPLSAATPLVSAIMPIHDRREAAAAATNITLFLEQSYQNKQLVIVSALGMPIVNNPHPQIVEITVPPGKHATAAAMRNEALAAASGDWLILWDCDDHHHPHRIALQMAHRREGFANFLAHQMRIDYARAVLVRVYEPLGIPSTILFPRGPERFVSELPIGEVTQLASQFAERRTVLDNGVHWFPGPVLYTAFWHGKNVLSREQFLGAAYADEHLQGFCPPELRDRHFEYLQEACGRYNLTLTRGPRS